MSVNKKMIINTRNLVIVNTYVYEKCTWDRTYNHPVYTSIKVILQLNLLELYSFLSNHKKIWNL